MPAARLLALVTLVLLAGCTPVGTIYTSMGATLPAYLAHKRQMLRPRSFEEIERHLTTHWQPLHRHPLAALTVAIGLAAGPLLALANRAAVDLLDPSAYIHAVLER